MNIKSTKNARPNFILQASIVMLVLGYGAVVPYIVALVFGYNDIRPFSVLLIFVVPVFGLSALILSTICKYKPVIIGSIFLLLIPIVFLCLVALGQMVH